MVRSCLALLAIVGALAGIPARFSGQASGWVLGSLDSTVFGQAGLRYIPTLTGRVPVTKGWALDAELSVNAWSTLKAWPRDSAKVEAALKPYRVWARISGSRFETRAGLQKINFGSATLLRPLMWFDRIDPRDPLQLTDGVYALLARYYFGKGGNIWAWGLLGNEETKGWEVFRTKRWTPEFGGRVQIPVPRGEIGAAYHHRSPDWNSYGFFEYWPKGDEDRIGLDGKWDLGVGAWFEGMLVRQMWASLYHQEGYPTWQYFLTLGLDYTFPLGSGVSVMGEHMVLDARDPSQRFDIRYHLSALSIAYPLGILDNLRALAYYDWQDRGLYRYLSWQRALDNWIFNVALFWNPDRASAFQGQTVSGAALGKGVQLTVVFNH